MTTAGASGETAPSSIDVTLLLRQWSLGDQTAFDQVSAIVYPELRRIAETYLRRERPDHTLQPTELINEAYLRLTRMGALKIEGRQRFYALAARLMRQVLVDHARTVNAQKRGRNRKRVTVQGLFENPFELCDQFLSINQGLEDLRTLDPRKADLIEVRYFAGFTLDEAAEHVGVSRAAAHRDLRLAEAWLNKRLSSPPGSLSEIP